MANLFTILFNKKKLKELEETNELLRKSLEECSSKLSEKQEHINATNAYWKKKMREEKAKKGPVRKKKDDGQE